MLKRFTMVILVIMLVLPVLAIAEQETAKKKDEVPAKLKEAYKLYTDKKLDESKKILDEFKASGQEHPQYYFISGLMALTKNQYSDAEEIFEDGLDKFPHDPMLLLAKAKYHTMINEPDDAAEMLEEYLEDNPSDMQAWHQLTVAYFKAQEFGDTIDAADHLIEVNEKDVFAYVYKGYAYIAKKKADKALEAFESGLKFDPKNKSLLQGKAMAENMKKQSRNRTRIPQRTQDSL